MIQFLIKPIPDSMSKATLFNLNSLSFMNNLDFYNSSTIYILLNPNLRFLKPILT